MGACGGGPCMLLSFPRGKRKTSFIAMTGDREKFLEAGMNDYIAKPVQVTELKKALGRVAEKLGKGGVQ
jgi:CheY-like chemotaxis protein